MVTVSIQRVDSRVAPAAARPVLYRRANRRVLSGVAGGIADHLGVSVIAIRVVFVLLVAAGGLGPLLYGVYWIVVPTPPGVTTSRRAMGLEYAAAALVVAGAVGLALRGTPLGSLFVPAVLACIGGALIWRQASDTQRQRWWRFSQSSLGARPAHRIGRARLVLGASLVALGAIAVLARHSLSAVRDSLIGVIVAAVGIAVITGPWWIGMVTELGAERRERIRSQARADLAERVHDSVLQTLALIQRNASSPREVARLARGQERELRGLLYGTATGSSHLAEGLRNAAAEVEDSYGIVVDVVVVGDVAMDERMSALIAATREALVNAAKHSGLTSVSLYAEVEASAVVVFVRDRGRGFAADEVAHDRQGLRNSIVGRIQRHDGQATVRSAPGEGTEVEIRMVNPA
jgi:signal transduction histidine kinase/phage shock protein PspC (stress-responsive transcriptional regulator)